MRRVVIVFLALLVISGACFAQQPVPSGCTLAGTWYGSSTDVPFPYYQGTITPSVGERFSITFQYYGEQQSFGYLSWTNWTGEVSKKSGHKYSGVAMSIWQWDSTKVPPGVDPSLPEVDFINIARMELIDCNTMRATYDLWYVYYNFTYDIKPPQEPPPPGFIMVLDPPLVEVYHRSPATVGSPKHPENARTVDPATNPELKRRLPNP